jgi:uncharacterized membrane protein
MFTCVVAVISDWEIGPALLRLLGRFHPAVVHFPIALITVAAVLELWQLVRRKSGLAPATPICLMLGAVSAVVAALFGWLLDAFDGTGGDLMELHKWLGMISVCAAMVAAALVGKAAASANARASLRLVLFAGAALVVATGYFGGELVFGSNHIFKGILEEKEVLAIALPDGGFAADAGQTVREHRVDFTKDIAPILRDNCLRCHGGGKVKGDLNLKTKLGAMRGGHNGNTIIPGDPERSTLYARLADTDPVAKMPPRKEKPLSKEQVEKIREWIGQGADWPDGVEVD